MNDKNEYIKTEKDIEIMKTNGKILARMLEVLKNMIKPGVNTLELEKEFIKMCKKYEARPACKGYAPYGLPPFPTGLCLSVNNESVHCYPKRSKILKEGDIVTVDTSIEKDGLYVDSAFGTGVGKVSEKRKMLIKAAEQAMKETINIVKEGIHIGDLGDKMSSVAWNYGFDVLTDYAGHGIGHSMHEWPDVPCYGKKGKGPVLEEGMTICIEALVCAGDPEVINTSEWETAMMDGDDWVQFEHTVLVKKDGYELITSR